MPKSPRRKPGKERAIKVEITERTRAILEAQQQRFRDDPGPSDPVFFDPDASEPGPMSAVMVQAETIEAHCRMENECLLIHASRHNPALSNHLTSMAH
jgi:hypothetical protein